MSNSLTKLPLVLAGVAIAAAVLTPAFGQGTDKFEKLTPAPRSAPAKPAPAVTEDRPVTAETDPKLKAALARVSTPVPEGLSLRKPAAGAPAQLRAFHGVWTGTNEFGVLVTAIIDSITDTGAEVIHSWGPGKGFSAGLTRLPARFQDSKLLAKDTRRTVEYRVLSGDSLEYILERQSGNHRGVLKRVY